MPTEKNIKTPEILWEHFESYKTECKANPRKENYWSNRIEKEVSISRERVMTWEGFEIWLRKNKIIVNIDDYKANKEERYSEYANIIHTIGREIWEDKFTGAVSGIYKENIIARELGIKDRSDITSDNKPITTIKLIRGHERTKDESQQDS